MIDCHTHLGHSSFDADRTQVLERAGAAGIQRIGLVGEDSLDNLNVLRLARSNPVFLPFLGLHPDRWRDDRPQAGPPPEEELKTVLAQIRENSRNIIGIGEVGLDRWVCRDENVRRAQAEAFRAFVSLALELDLPLNVHSRSAGRYTLDILKEMGASRVLMHAYDGRASTACQGAEAGFVFSIPPSVVRSPQKQKMVRNLPLDALALETDSPVLGPEPGQRNEPANLVVSLREIARIKGVSEPEVVQAANANLARIFKVGSGW
ncbi:MAG: TatD family hydrolase [Deltaproteobacteria bacterium]|nr:TatD family hydrolase [Deltaproteobacteria bacterium]